eukprot:c19866_g1_i1.p3 GENE.c19866_g1_i1~~c19866_g1_i1.p3  ORF type:complete len:196 (-),score=-78.51 c19866_g1_i1:160-747(-)
MDRLLVDDGIDSNGSLAGLTITNNQLSLSTTNGHQRVDGLQSSLHGLMHGFTRNDTRGLNFNTTSLCGLDGTLTIDGVTKSINDAAQQGITDGHVNDGTSTLDNIAFLDGSVRAEHDNTDIVVFQIESHTLDSGAELNHLTGLNLIQTVHTSNTITNRQDTSDLIDMEALIEVRNTLLENGGKFGSGNSLLSHGL